jgi:hypothetical protein
MMISDMDIGSGRTTQQMREAPRHALFVWCNGHLSYPRDLARSLGRDDLDIVGPYMLDRRQLAGRRIPVVVDHATKLSSEKRELLEEYRQFCLARRDGSRE